MRFLGFLLILIGIAGFLVEGISWTTSDEVVDLGVVEVEKEEKRTIPVTPVASAVAIVTGIGLVVLDVRRPSS